MALAFVRANFNGGRYLWSTGEEVKRKGFEPKTPGKKLKGYLDLADNAVKTLKEDGTPITNETLRQRMDLMSKRILWSQNELSVWQDDKALTFTIPDSVDLSSLKANLEDELRKQKPNFKTVIDGHLADGANELFGFWNAVLEGRIKPKDGKPLRPSSVSAKRQTYKLVRAFNPRLTFADMDKKFFNSFVQWLEEDREHLPPDGRRPEGYYKQAYDRNSIAKHVKELKSMLNLARRDELPVSDKFTGWRVAKDSNEVVNLDKSEVETLMNMELTGTMKDVRDTFIMACFLGLRIGDYSQLVKENFVRKNGVDYFAYVQEKTGTRVEVPVLPPLQKFMSKWDAFPRLISEQNTREYLKKICKEAGFTDRVVTKIRDGKPEYEMKWKAIGPHSARRTFASALYYGWWSKPLPGALVMRYTGHKSEKSFLLYIGAKDADLEAKTLEILGIKSQMKIA